MALPMVLAKKHLKLGKEMAAVAAHTKVYKVIKKADLARKTG